MKMVMELEMKFEKFEKKKEVRKLSQIIKEISFDNILGKET
jgi:hypothetical protein